VSRHKTSIGRDQVARPKGYFGVQVLDEFTGESVVEQLHPLKEVSTNQRELELLYSQDGRWFRKCHHGQKVLEIDADSVVEFLGFMPSGFADDEGEES